MDNWYTSPTLLKYLSSKGIGACGTVKANRKGMPFFKNKLKRGDCKVAVTTRSKILACKWMDKRDVHMLSTVYKHKMVTIHKKNKTTTKKPDCVHDYNNNMGLVDKTDMMMSFNGTVRKTVKWYKKFFFHLLDIAVLNSGILYSKIIKTKLKLPDFRLQLISQLIENHCKKFNSTAEKQRQTSENIPIRLVARHFPSSIATTGKKKIAQKKCFVHANTALGP